MDIQEYNRVITQYQELMQACMGIPQQKAIQDAQLNFISKAYIEPAYTMKASWLIPEGRGIEVDRVIQMHPYDFCIAYNQITKDHNAALDLLRKYIHERIDNLFRK
ncbi:MAG TPA: hypothetical protein VL443_30090 [Cyclobacteriaceae bacterium]|jgi:hypothetical protein|nr:hypothetical protein [Cyclobacteriaceae bacterium]